MRFLTPGTSKARDTGWRSDSSDWKSLKLSV